MGHDRRGCARMGTWARRGGKIGQRKEGREDEGAGQLAAARIRQRQSLQASGNACATSHRASEAPASSHTNGPVAASS
jgi:hypothetical protein